MVSCDAPIEGRYITIMIDSADFLMKFAEIFAFESVNLASNPIILDDLTVSSGILSSIISTSDHSLADNARCVSFSHSGTSSSPFITIKLIESSFVTGAFISGYSSGQNFYPTVQVEVGNVAPTVTW